MALSLYKMNRGRRGKKRKQEEESGGRVSPGLLRVQVDINEIELPRNVTLDLPDPTHLQTFRLSIVPDQGYWRGASFTFQFVIPDNYPYKPPKVTCITKIYHPNIDTQGNVCLNLLKEDWRPILSVQQIVHGLIFLFLEPNPADPLNLEAAEVFRNNEPQFRRNVERSLNGGNVDGVQYPRMDRR